MRDAGHAVCVAALYDVAGAVGQKLAAAGVEVMDIGIRCLRDGTRLRRLTEAIREFRPDLVHSWLFHANLVSRWARPSCVPLICSLRVAEPRRAHRALDRLSRFRVNRYLAVSEGVAEFAITRLAVPRSKVTVIGNGIDFDTFEAVRTRKPPVDRLRGLCVARLTRQKGLDILLAALARLPGDLDWEWHFVGDAPEPRTERQLRRFADQNGLTDRLTWHGSLPREQVVKLYGTANLFALPSRWEGQPNVVLEALAAGVPVAAARVEGIDELRKQDTDALRQVDPNTPPAWTEAILGLWRNPGARESLRDHGLSLARERTWGAVVQKHVGVYRQVLTDRV